MCSHGSAASAPISLTVPGAEGDLLNQVLSADAAVVPKVSVPLPALETMKKKMVHLGASFGTEFDKEPTYHVTSEEAFLSASQPGEVAVVGPKGGMVISVHEPESDGEGQSLSEIWKIALMMIPTSGHVAAEPQVTVDVVVGGDSAKIVGYETSPTANEELGALGLNVMCIIKSGGASILTTIVKCLPNLAAGPQAFMAALTASLGPGSVDLIASVMACF